MGLVAAVQVRSTSPALAAVAVRFVGAVGGWVPPPPPLSASISTAARSQRSAVGAVSLMVTVLPVLGVVAVWRCSQYVSPTGARYWSTSCWLAPGVRDEAASQSSPLPHTQDPA